MRNGFIAIVLGIKRFYELNHHDLQDLRGSWFPAVVDLSACPEVLWFKANLAGVISSGIEPTFLVAIRWANSAVYGGIEVTKGYLRHGSAVLIGMDIIRMEDFVINNKGGQTFSHFACHRNVGPASLQNTLKTEIAAALWRPR